MLTKNKYIKNKGKTKMNRYNAIYIKIKIKKRIDTFSNKLDK